MMRWLMPKVIILLVFASLYHFGSAAYIHSKARVAQWFLDDTWQQSLASKSIVQPCFWSDTYPVARLQVPRLNQDLVVLFGASAKVMSFGPGFHPDSSTPNQMGNTVISGHRDTHFSFLSRAKKGDLIHVQLSDGSEKTYQINELRITTPDDGQWLAQTQEDVLTLITCYPFDAVGKAPLRVVARAQLYN